jgi:AraC-like DNA-binding protein
MTQTQYPKKSPAGAFRVAVERGVVHDSSERMHYQDTYTVEVVPTGCDFLDHLAALVVGHGNRSAKTYAAMLGTTERHLNATLATLSGAGLLDWTDEFAGAVGEALLGGTNWQVARVARAALMSSPRAFNYFFRRRYKCTPQQWRWNNR